MKNTPTVESLLEKITVLEENERKLRQNEARLESLLSLSQMTDVTETQIREHALESVVALTGSKAGYLHFFDEEKRTLNLASWSEAVLKECTAERTEHYPLDQAGIWADCVRLRKPVVHNDYQAYPSKKGYPEGHFHLARHLSLPIFDREEIVAVAGVGNKDTPYDETDIRQAMLFMNNMWAILQQKRAEVILRKYSMEDGLTGLANRRRLEEVMEIEWRRARRNGSSLSIIMADIDFFKAYNDIYGHQAGDDCLRKVAECLRGKIRRGGELVARYGGEEFMVVLPNSRLEHSLTLAEILRRSIREISISHEGSKGNGYVTISAGVAATIPSEKIELSQLIKRADEELYKAKRGGRNTVKGGEVIHNQNQASEQFVS